MWAVERPVSELGGGGDLQWRNIRRPHAHVVPVGISERMK
jgi:hypothetical protein